MKVPYYKQEFPWSCFPACIKMVLEYYGIKKSEKELRLLLRATFGAIWYYIQLGLESLGLHFYYFEGFSLDELKELTKNKIPVIVSLKFSEKHLNHTVVVVGVTDEFVIVHDPERGENVKMELERFLEAWSKRKHIAGFIKRG